MADPKKTVKPVDELQRKEGESAQAYNERVPIAFQPVQPTPTIDYLGRPLN